MVCHEERMRTQLQPHTYGTPLSMPKSMLIVAFKLAYHVSRWSPYNSILKLA